MLQLEHIKKSYNKNEVLKDINYIFDKGQIYPILGSVGSGRTTLFDCVCGNLSVDSGRVKVIGMQDDIFYAAKQSVLPMYITGYEFIKFLCSLCGDRSQPDDYLDRAHISEETKDTMICDYSFEDKKKLQLAAFLVQKPYVIMFDEPFDYCSEEYINDFIDVLNSVKDDHIILISTGLLSISQKISPDTIVLNNGEFNFISEEMIKMPEVKKAVLDILGETENEVL